MIEQFLMEYGFQILFTIITAFLGFIGMGAKKLYKEHVDTEIKEKMVLSAVKAIEQLYKDWDGSAKKEAAMQYATELLNAKGITIGEIELEILLEAAVGEFKKQSGLNKEEQKNAE